MTPRLGRRRRSKGDLALQRAAVDPEAFGDFYDAYAHRVTVFFVRRTLDAELALDFVAETFAVALERCSQFRGTTVEEEQGWLFAIARSQLTHYWRQGSVERAALARLGIQTQHMSSADLERVEELAGLDDLRRSVASAMAELPPDRRAAVNGRIVREKSYAELSAELGVTEQVVRARVSRGLRALAAQLTVDAEDAA